MELLDLHVLSGLRELEIWEIQSGIVTGKIVHACCGENDSLDLNNSICKDLSYLYSTTSKNG